jgi:hypothetical protein
VTQASRRSRREIARKLRASGTERGFDGKDAVRLTVSHGEQS